MQRIAVFDSGLGGLTVLQALRQHIPSCHYIYLGDTARTPYGPKSVLTVQRYAKECAHFLLAYEPDLLVVACNTASSVALDILKKECPCPVLGTIDPLLHVYGDLIKEGPVGVIGTHGTILSGIYEKHIKELYPETKVISKSCPLFVPLVEEGMCTGEIVDKVTELYLSPLKQDHVTTLILGCTHYPLLVSAISSYLGPKVKIIDSAQAIAREIKTNFGSDFPVKTFKASSPVQYYVTDDVSRFNHLARTFLEEAKVEAVKVEGW